MYTVGTIQSVKNSCAKKEGAGGKVVPDNFWSKNFTFPVEASWTAHKVQISTWRTRLSSLGDIFEEKRRKKRSTGGKGFHD